MNVIPILKPGEKISQVWSEEKQVFLDELADGKSAKGYSSWSQWQFKQQTPEDITKLFQDKQDCNIAILTGKVSRIIAFDIDGDEAKKHFDRLVESLGDTETENAIKNTMQIKSGSGKGKHIILRFNPKDFQNGQEIKTSTLWSGEGQHSEIKLKAEGGYIIAPPSLHASGNRYEFINKVEPLTFTRDQILKLISAFDPKIFDNGNGNEVNNNNGKAKEHTVYQNLTDEKIQYILSKIKDYYYKGQRDEIIFGLVGLLFKCNVTLSSAKYLVTVLCDSTHDDEKNSRFKVLENTYLKGLNGEEIKGSTHLLEILKRNLNDSNDKDFAKRIVKDIAKVLEEDDKQKEKIDDKNNDSGLRPTQILIKLARENTELFFKDQYGKGYAKVWIKDHNGILYLEGNKFKYFLSKLYYENSNGKVASKEAINDAIGLLQAETFYEDNNTIPLNLRVALKDDALYIDMTDEKYRSIKLTKNSGWEIVNDIPPLFVRYNQKPLIEPDRNYEPDVFDKFLNLTNIKDPQHRLLVKVYIVSLFIPEIQHPILLLHGEPNSAKTTLYVMIKQIVDPAKPNLLSIHNDRSEFIQQLSHTYIAYYDNVKHVPEWLSDEACKAVTGIGHTKRKLFSDDEDIVYEYRRCLGFNGINVSLIEPDALDRSILIELLRIPPEKRITETEIMAKFEEMLPKLFGCILDIVVKALNIKPAVKLDSLPRMTDFAQWGEALARAMGYEDMEFINAYFNNIGKQNIEAIEAHPLGLAMIKLIGSLESDRKTVWQGSPSELLELLDRIALQKMRNQHLWPKAPNALVRKLNTIKSNLLEGLGINVTISRITTGKNKNTSTIRIEKIPPPSPPSPPGENYAQNEGKIGGGISECGDIISTVEQIRPPENAEIHTQKSESGGSGHSGGLIPTLEGGAYINTSPLSDRYVAFDFEWSSSNIATEHADTSIENQITAAAFVDNQGNSIVLHILDFSEYDNPERELLLNINQEIMKYDYSIGWYSTGVAKYHEDTCEYLDGVDSDLAVLHSRCLANGIDSIVDFNAVGTTYLRRQKHIDLYNVFGKPMVQNTIFNNAYRTLKLDEVSKAVLEDSSNKAGGGGGKYKGLTGKDIQSLPVEEQKKYVLRDVELVMQISKHNNGEVLDAMKSISEITGLDFERVCRTGISTWWAAIFDNMVENGECQEPSASFETTEQYKQEYVGGMVLQPRKGLYHNLIVVDVTSLYPTIAILHNISFDTVNCKCCKDNSNCMINEEITKDCRIEKDYWLCRQKQGAFPQKLKIFKEERIKQKNLGNQVKQLALKILINGGYGVFGSRYFKYYDPRVAELITAYGRYTLTKMLEIARNVGFEIVYGDTDSLFLYNRNENCECSKEELISRFTEECNKQLGIEVEHSKTYKTAIISDKKKHYVGWSDVQGNQPDIVGMEGEKNDRPKWINSIFRQTVYDIVTNNSNAYPVINLMKAISDLESGHVNPELLKRFIRLSKNPEEYENENDRKRKIGLAIGAKKGDVIDYFESDNKEGYSLNPQDISFKKYKIMLWKTLKDILEIAGYDVVTIEKELFLSNMTTRQNLRVVWSGNSNLLGGEQ